MTTPRSTGSRRPQMNPLVLLLDLARSFGGAEQRVVDLAKHLPAEGVPAAIVCLADSPLYHRAEQDGLRAYALHSHREDPRNIALLRGMIQRFGGPVVDSHNTQSHLAAVSATVVTRTPRVVTVHSSYGQSERKLAGVSHHELILRQAVKRAHVITVTQALHTEIVSYGVDSERVSTVWSAVAQPDVDAAHVAELRDELTRGSDERLAVAAGRLVPAKDYMTMLDAVAERASLVGHDDRFTLAIAGSGALHDDLTAAAQVRGLTSPDAHHRVIFLGQRSDVPDVMSAADVLWLTSKTEGLPYTVLEAGILGTPILTTDVGAIPTVFPHKHAAQVVARDSAHLAADFALADVALSGDPAYAQSLGRGAADIVHRQHSTGTMVRDTIAAYQAARGR